MTEVLKPIYLLADSEILFWKYQDSLMLEPPVAAFDKKALKLKAAYIGVSNQDNPAYFEIFRYAMEQVGVSDAKMITTAFTADEKQFLQSADIILLAGGDTKLGWDIIAKTNMDAAIRDRYYQGALLIGVSAGAIQLGLYGIDNQGQFFETLKLAPFLIDVHDENTDWRRLKTCAAAQSQNLNAYGIPLRAGMIYHPEHQVEALRHPLNEFRFGAGIFTHNLIFPEQE